MHRASASAELWDVGARSHVGWRVAVLSDDFALASRATEALERDGLIITLEAVGRDVAALETARRRPTMLIVEARCEEREIEHMLDWAGKRLAGAVVLVVLRSTERFDVGLL